MRVRSEQTALTRPSATLSRLRGRGLFALLLVLVSGCATRPDAKTSHLWAGLTPGQYTVGFRNNTWYPATAGGELLRFRDYVPLLEDVDALLHGYRISDATIVELFDTRMYARRDAPAVEHHFPRVQIALKEKQTAADHAVLAEFIASHGYVVTLAREAAVDPTVTTWDFAGTVFPEIGKAMKHDHNRRHLASESRKTLQLISARTSRRPT